MAGNGFILNKINEVQFYTCPEISGLGFAEHFFSTRIGGISEGFYESLNLGIYTDDLNKNINNNFKRIFQAANMNVDKATYLFQRHGNEIYVINENNYKDTCGRDGDAIITQSRGIPIGVFTADCVPVILADKSKKAVAVVHAGWKGTYLAIVKNVIDFMLNNLSCSKEDIVAAIGPSIGPCCFEVGKDVADKFEFVHIRDEKYYVDLWKENAKQIESCGVDAKNIIESHLCTMCDKDKFFSYRRDSGKTGRLGTFIQII